MRNLRFGVFFLGLVLVVGVLVAGVGAQSRGFAVQAEPGDRNVFMLDGRGAQLGVMVSDVDAKAATGGVHIDDVNADSPAEKAGIKKGDVIVEFDGEKVRSARQFTRLVQETPEGRQVSIALMRDGKRQTVTATPEDGRMTWNGFGPDVDRALQDAQRGMRNFRFEMPPQFYEFRDNNRDRIPGEPRTFEYRVPERVMPSSRGRLGVTVQSLTRDLEAYFGAKNGGALVSSVTPDSAASKAGVKAGDVITSVNGHGVRDSDELMREIENANGDVTIVVLRDKKEMTLKATLENGPTGQRAIRPSRPGIRM